ncbi:MAG: hypothetical protein M5T61_15165 [Acidimicrobiia bacterium]|nr:hypothetical protein [Acidimicrobiia bacterium]
MTVLLVVLVPVALIALLVARSRSGVSVSDVGSSTAAVSDAGVRTTADIRRASAAETVRGIGRVEGRLMFSSLWFAVGLAFCALIILAFAVAFADENNEPWAEFAQMAPWFVHPLAGMTVLASHRATTRSVRDGTEEVFGVCPTQPEVRTLGHLAASWLPVLVSAVFLVVFGLLLLVRSPGLHGPVTADSTGDVLGAMLLGVGSVALGVALGRWIRFALAPIVVVVAILFLSTGISGIGGRGWNPYVQLSTAPTIEAPSPVFADRPVWSHALWILALVLLVGLLAMLRHRRDRPILLGVGGAIVLAMVAAFGATREMPAASASAIADRVARPEAHQDCVDIAGRVDVCVFPFHAEYAGRIVADVTPVAWALPSAVGPMTIRQVYEGSIEQLPPEVRRRLPDRVAGRPPNEVPFSGFDELGNFTGPRRDLALAAVGLPTRPDDELMPAVVAGEARGVVAVWLTVRGLDLDDQLRRARVPETSSDDPFENGSLDGVGECSTPSVVWSRQDLEAARAVIQVPDEVIEAALASDWARWTDPSTGTDELLAHLELAPVGPFDQVTPRPGEPC